MTDPESNSCLTSVDSSRMSKNMTIYGHEEFKRRRVTVIYVWRAVLVQPAGFVYLCMYCNCYIHSAPFIICVDKAPYT